MTRTAVMIAALSGVLVITTVMLSPLSMTNVKKVIAPSWSAPDEWDFPTSGSMSFIHPWERSQDDHHVIARHIHRLAAGTEPRERKHLLLAHEFIDVTDSATHWTARLNESPVWSDPIDDDSKYQYIISAKLGVSKSDIQAAYPDLSLNYYIPFNSWKVSMTSAQAFAMASESETIARVGPWDDIYSMELKMSTDFEYHPHGFEPILMVHVPKDWAGPEESMETLAEEILASYGGPLMAFSVEEDHMFMVDVVTHDRLKEIGAKLASHPAVEHVEALAIGQPTNAQGRISVQGGSGKTDPTPIWSKGLHGEGVVIGVHDTGLDREHCQFVDDQPIGASHRKIVGYHEDSFKADNDDRESGHGSHCGSSIAGEWNGGDPEDPNQTSGVAYKAKLSVSDGTDPDTTGIFYPFPRSQLFDNFVEDGAYVSSHSWSETDASGTYSSYAALVDTYMSDHLYHLPLYAASNDGEDGPGHIGTPGAAKNALTIAAAVNDPEAWMAYSFGCEPEDQPVSDPDATCGYAGNTPFSWNDLTAEDTDFATYKSTAYFSSIGPLFDGRIKPDVAASGMHVLAARAGPFGTNQTCESTYKQGTSMACPTAAGAAGLAVQYLQEGFHPTGKANRADEINDVYGAGLKAMLINGAHRMGGRRIGRSDGQQTLDGDTYNGYTGYGALKLDTVLAFDDSDFNNTLYWNGAPGPLSDDAQVDFTGDSRTITVRAGSSAPLRITMCFFDTAASQQSALSLNNDLDLTVEDWDGNVLHFGNELAFNAQQGSASKVDSCEKIEIPDPDPQFDYVVRVKAVDLPDGTMPFAVVATGAIPPERDFRLQPWMVAVGVGGLAVLGLGVFCLVARPSIASAGSSAAASESSKSALVSEQEGSSVLPPAGSNLGARLERAEARRAKANGGGSQGSRRSKGSKRGGSQGSRRKSGGSRRKSGGGSRRKSGGSRRKSPRRSASPAANRGNSDGAGSPLAQAEI